MNTLCLDIMVAAVHLMVAVRPMETVGIKTR
jgi:hypothetical protein